MDIAVVALERLRQGADACDLVPADVAQQLHSLAGQDTGKRIPAFERQMTLAGGFAALPTVPGVHEPARRFLLDRAAHRDLHLAHSSPRTARTPDQAMIARPYHRDGFPPAFAGVNPSYELCADDRHPYRAARVRISWIAASTRSGVAGASRRGESGWSATPAMASRIASQTEIASIKGGSPT